MQINRKIVMNSNEINSLNRGNLEKSYLYYINKPVGCVNSLKLKYFKKLIEKELQT